MRAEIRLFALASVLFYGSGLLVAWLVYSEPDLIYSFIDQESLAKIEEMYDPGNRHADERESDDNVLMFGFYIWNNIGIAFRTFASGLVFGIGTLFILLFNGLYFGLIASHLTRLGFTETFFPFVIGHGSFELTAILLAGVAGMRLGLSLIAPGPRSRLQSLRNASRGSLPIVYGCAGMLAVAAGIEAFWSPNQAFSPQVKYIVGAGLWVLVFAYLLGAGRGVERGRAG